MRLFVILLRLAVSLHAVDLELQPGTVLVLPSAKDGAVLLAKEDAYFKRMSPFDRAARIGKSEAPSIAEFAAYVAAQAVDYTDEEIATVTAALESIRPALSALKLSLPPTITLAKTNGREDIDAAYCRGPLVVMPKSYIGRRELPDILIHEVFHVFSSHHPELREKMYGLLGFVRCVEPPLTPSVDARRFTNPDAMGMDFAISVKHEDRDILVLPTLLAKSAIFDVAKKGRVFEQIDFVLLEVTIAAGRATLVEKDGEPVTHLAHSVPGFLRAMSRNTNYIWHPEEVLADNLVRAVRPGRKLNSPELPKQLVEIMQSGTKITAPR